MYVLITSPHPDDDIVGCAERILRAVAEGHTVGVWFMTCSTEERRVEATRALNVLNVHDIYWRTLPFYHHPDRKWTHEDVNICYHLLRGIRPNELAVCYDADPMETHVRCYHIIQRAIKSRPQDFYFIQQVRLYYSVWGSTSAYADIPCEKVIRDVDHPDLKRRALACHESQQTLVVHDGMGDSLIARGNLEQETYFLVNIHSFCRIPPCLPNLKRRTTLVDDVASYVFSKYVKCLVPGSRVIFPTGNTPLPLYKRMREETCNNVEIYQLDEYRHSTEYQEYLRRELSPLHTFHFIDAYTDTVGMECERHDAISQQVDLCILGIGANGHIGFNEPGSTAEHGTRKVTLHPATRRSNVTEYTEAITLGIRTILTSKKIVMMANKNKLPILQQIWDGPSIQEHIPATYLSRHPNIEIVMEK